MAERSTHSSRLRSRKPLFLFLVLILLFVFSCCYFFFFLGSTGGPEAIDHAPLVGPKFFSVIENRSAVQRYSDSTSFSENNGREEIEKCDPSKATLKVFMYDLPPEFHFGLLDWKPEGGSMWPDIHNEIPVYPGGLNLQHSIEYWLTLDLLSSRFSERRGPCAAVRVDDSHEADIVFVPFFSSLSYNRYGRQKSGQDVNQDKVLQQRLVQFLANQEEWKMSGGRDHVIMAHHPNSMLEARLKLWPCLFILADFGRYPPNVANVEKDVIAPYKHVVRTIVNDSSGFDDRPTLLYFLGAIYRKDGGYIRQELFYLLKEEKDVHFDFGSVRRNGINDASEGMHSSKFCLNIAGDTPSSNRLFDAIASHCVPVVISDEIELPYEDVLDYSKFCIFVRTSDALKKDFLIKMIRGIGQEEWTQMYERLKEVGHYFELQYPSQKDDAVQMTWQAVARKVKGIRLKLHRARRFSRYELGDEPRRFSQFDIRR